MSEPESADPLKGPLGTARDHRGRRCRLLNLADDPTIERGAVDWTVSAPLVGCLGIVLLAGGVLTAIAVSNAWSRRDPMLVAPCLLVLAPPLTWMAWRLTGDARRRLRGENVRDAAREVALLRRGRCPGCGYRLWELPREADGLTVCAECGAAWRVGNPPDPET